MTPQTFLFGFDSGGFDQTAHGLYGISYITVTDVDGLGSGQKFGSFVYYAENDCFLANRMLIARFMFGLW